MKFNITKNSIQIIPQDDEDEVYLESVLNLWKKDDEAIVVRVAPYNLDHSWAYAEVKRKRG